MTVYKVTAPYITVKVETPLGSQVQGFAAGALLPDGVVEESIRHHLRRKMIEEVEVGSGQELAESESAENGDGDGDGEDGGDPSTPPPPPPPLEPAPSVGPEPAAPPESGPGSGKAAWVDYAMARGMDRAEAEGMSRDDLIKALKD
jgi:hypothetical protein